MTLKVFTYIISVHEIYILHARAKPFRICGLSIFPIQCFKIKVLRLPVNNIERFYFMFFLTGKIQLFLIAETYANINMKLVWKFVSIKRLTDWCVDNMRNSFLICDRTRVKRIIYLGCARTRYDFDLNVLVYGSFLFIIVVHWWWCGDNARSSKIFELNI